MNIFSRVCRHGRLPVAACALFLTACGDHDTVAPGTDAQAYVRYVNSTYQQGAAGTPTVTTSTVGGVTVTTTVTPTTYTAATIDVLLDSATASPSALALAPNSVTNGGTTVGPSPAHRAVGYAATTAGVHSFVARMNGLTPVAGFSFFTTPSGTQFLPKLYLPPSRFHTFVVAGINPAPSGGAQLLAPATAIPFTMLVDDPFTPPSVVTNGSAALQARLHVYNCAPFATTSGASATMNVYLTPGTTPPVSVAGLNPQGTSAYRSTSVYTNVTAGTYVLTIMAGQLLVYQAPVTLNAGEVHSFVVQNNMPAYVLTTTITAPPAPAAPTTVVTGATPTFQVVDIVDNLF